MPPWYLMAEGLYPEHKNSRQVCSIWLACPLTLIMPGLLCPVSQSSFRSSRYLPRSPLLANPPRALCLIKEISSCLLLNSRDILVVLQQHGRGRVIFLALLDCQAQGWKTPRVSSHCPSSQTWLFPSPLSETPRVSSKALVSPGSVSPLQILWASALIFHAGSREPFPRPCTVPVPLTHLSGSTVIRCPARMGPPVDRLSSTPFESPPVWSCGSAQNRHSTNTRWLTA